MEEKKRELNSKKLVKNSNLSYIYSFYTTVSFPYFTFEIPVSRAHYFGVNTSLVPIYTVIENEYKGIKLKKY